MKKREAAWILTFAGILLVLSCIILGKALVVECSRLNGGNSMQKVMVSVKNQMDRQGVNSFSLEDIKRLKKELSTKEISFAAQSGLVNTSVSYEGRVLPVRLTGIDYRYPSFDSVTLKEGSFITQMQEEEGAMVAVIEEELARELFKTIQVTGKTLTLYDGVFRIIGVVKKEDTLLGKLTDDGLPDVYIPASVMLERDATARTTALQIKAAHAGTPEQNKDEVSFALRKIGKNPSNYTIIDYNLTLALIEQGPLLFLFALGIASILMGLVHIKSLLSGVYALIRDGCRTDYFSNVIRRNRRGIGTCLFEMVLLSAGIVFIWRGISFRPYIPARYIPDELINLSYYSDLIKGAIQGGIQNRGYVAPRSELIVNTVHGLVNLLSCISAVLGLLLLYTGFRDLEEIDMDSNGLVLIIALFFILSLAILAAVAFLTGLPYRLDVKSMGVVWAFLSLKALFISKRKESGYKNV